MRQRNIIAVSYLSNRSTAFVIQRPEYRDVEIEDIKKAIKDFYSYIQWEVTEIKDIPHGSFKVIFKNQSSVNLTWGWKDVINQTV